MGERRISKKSGKIEKAQWRKAQDKIEWRNYMDSFPPHPPQVPANKCSAVVILTKLYLSTTVMVKRAVCVSVEEGIREGSRTT